MKEYIYLITNRNYLKYIKKLTCGILLIKLICRGITLQLARCEASLRPSVSKPRTKKPPKITMGNRENFKFAHNLPDAKY